MTAQVRIGVLRLADSAPVMVAEARGIFAELGLDAEISVEPSWATITDKLSYGVLDAAIMLPSLVLAAVMGLRGPSGVVHGLPLGRQDGVPAGEHWGGTRRPSGADLIVPMGLTQGGNSIVFGATGHAPIGSVRPHVREWLLSQPSPPRLGVVHRYSTHNLLLRYWLALAGVDPDHDVETVILPPTQVVDALADGRIAGFCAGAPYGDLAQRSGAGQTMIGTSSVWPSHPEKCLGVNGQWARENPGALLALVRSLLRAQVICDRPADADWIATLLSRRTTLGLPREATLMALPGGDGVEQIRFYQNEVWFPAHSHALWFLRQMRRWGWVGSDIDLDEVVQLVYRPDLLAPAVGAEGLFPASGLQALEGHAMVPMPTAQSFAGVSA